MFPSPTGVLYISIKTFHNVLTFAIYVSVPYWGSLYFNSCYMNCNVYSMYTFPSPTGVLYISMFRLHYTASQNKVSVPYWGSLYFNYSIYFNIKDCLWFPSPTGVLYISILSSAALIITGLQSRIAVQNLIRLFTI